MIHQSSFPCFFGVCSSPLLKGCRVSRSQARHSLVARINGANRVFFLEILFHRFWKFFNLFPPPSPLFPLVVNPFFVVTCVQKPNSFQYSPLLYGSHRLNSGTRFICPPSNAFSFFQLAGVRELLPPVDSPGPFLIHWVLNPPFPLNAPLSPPFAFGHLFLGLPHTLIAFFIVG